MGRGAFLLGSPASALSCTTSRKGCLKGEELGQALSAHPKLPVAGAPGVPAFTQANAQAGEFTRDQETEAAGGIFRLNSLQALIPQEGRGAVSQPRPGQEGPQGGERRGR